MSTTDHGQRLSFTELLARIGRESLLIIVIAVNLFLLLTLLGYDPKDSGWSHLGYQPEVTNMTGPAGAWVADLFISMLGLGAYVVPLLFIYPALRFMFLSQHKIIDAVPYFILRCSGSLLALTALSALSAIHISNTGLDYPFTAGGILGEGIAEWAVRWLSITGASVILFTLLLFGITLLLEMGWARLLEILGGFIVRRTEGLLPDKSINERDQHGLSDEALAQAEASFSKGLSGQDIEEEQAPPIIRDQLFDHSFTPDRNAQSLVKPVDTQNDVDATNNRRSSNLFSVDASAGTAIDTNVDTNVDTTGDAGVLDKVVPEPVNSGAPEIATKRTSNIQKEITDEVQVAIEPEKSSVRIVPLSEAHKPMQDKELGLDDTAKAKHQYKRKIPPLDLLDPPELNTNVGFSPDELEHMSRLLESKLKDFSVVAEVVEVNPGPVITRFEIQPAPGVKASKITNLAKDLARSMAVSSVRVVEVIPGKSVVGIEIPNEDRLTVHLSEVLSSKPYLSAASKLTIGLGNDIAGNPVVANLAKMPHLLVAGTTGSGKSVGVNAMLLSLLFKATPDEVRLIMVDPKMLELSIYEGIPHLLTPVITDMKDAAAGLRWCVGEMERRYRLMAKMGVRNLAGFNDKIEEARKKGKPLQDPLWNAEENGEPFGTPAPELEPLPYIVVVIDEFADMMMIVGKKVEELIARIAQKARAAGIHLILATQRPSVDVITGLIKANIPTRIAFQVSSRIDSRTILDQSGAEHLLGWGDMLYLPAGTSLPNRVHGAFVSDDEVHRVVEAWKKLGQPNYITEITDGDMNSDGGGSASLFDDEQDSLYDEAVAFVLETRKASISSVQRRLKIGYNRAARMIEAMEAAGVVSTAGTNGQREVLAPSSHREV